MADFKLHLKSDIELERLLGKMPEIQDASLEAADAIAASAQSSAPFDTGTYESGISVQQTKKGARVFASDPKSAWIEFGIPSRGVPAQFILRRAAEAAGFKFKKRKR